MNESVLNEFRRMQAKYFNSTGNFLDVFFKSVLIKSKAKNTLKCILKGDTVLQKYRIQDTKNFLTNTERSTDTFCSRRSNELKKII